MKTLRSHHGIWTLIGSAFLAAASYGQIINLSAPVSESLTPSGVYWAMDNGVIGASSPDPTDDGSGNGFSGTLIPASDNVMPVYQSGRFGTGIQLVSGPNPQSDQNANVSWNGASSYSGQLDFVGTSFTMGAWVKFDSFTPIPSAGQLVYVMERGASTFSAGGNFVSLQLSQWSTDPQWSYYLRLGNGTDVPVDLFSTASVTIADGNWHHVGFSLAYGEAESTITLWYDGEILGEQLLTDYKLAATTWSGERQFTVGERNTSTYQSNFNGRFDDVFMTEGVYAFAVPEPSVLAFAGLGGLLAGAIGLRKKRKSLV